MACSHGLPWAPVEYQLKVAAFDTYFVSGWRGETFKISVICRPGFKGLKAVTS